MCQLRARPGQTEAVIRRAIEQLTAPSRGVAGRRSARLFQRVDDPAWLLCVGEWDSRAAFDAHRPTASMPGTPDQPETLPSCRCYRRLTLFERVLTPIQLARVDVVAGPAESHAARRDLVLAHQRASRYGDPEPVLLATHEAIDAPCGLLIIRGWEVGSAPESPEWTDPGAERALLDRLVATGAAVQRFVGRPVAEAFGS
jgi:quinol monooxygenase YgiN